MITKNQELPSIFDEFAEARKNGFIRMHELKKQGVGVVGTFCTYTPQEVFLAADLVPVSLCSTSDETISEAEKILPSNLCPLIKSSYGFAITDKCPYFYFSDLIVGETTCDGKTKMYELLGDIKNTHVMQLPKNQDLESARSMWRDEILRLIDRIEKDFQVQITDEKLKKAVHEKNIERKLLKQWYELSVQSPPPITGLEQLQAMHGTQFMFSHQDKVDKIEQTIATVTEAYQQENRPVADDAPRILITGCPIGGVTEKVVRAIEESGAVVVAYENCTGAKQYDRLIAEDGDIISNIADYYLDIGCSVMTPDNNRKELLLRLCEQFHVDGVVEMVLQSCHTYAIESYNIRKILEEQDIPYLYLETDYSTSDYGQLSTRTGAFVEMLG